MVNIVSNRPIVITCRRLALLLFRFISLPHDGTASIREPPDANKVALCPQTSRPGVEELAVGVNGLLPFEREGRDGADGDLCDDAEGAE